MDDLSRLNWSTTNKPPNTFANVSLKSSPLSSAGHQNGSTPSKKTAGDSFSNLVSFSRDKQASNLSLLEQQKKLEEQRQKDEEGRRKQMDSLFGGAGWDSLAGRGSGTPASTAYSAPPATDDDDLLAAFNSSAPVDSTSHYPAPATSVTPQPQNGFDLLGEPSFAAITTPSLSNSHSLDLFGTPTNLPSRGTSPIPPPQSQTDDDDFDILGDLAKPVSELPRPQPTPSPKPVSRPASVPPTSDPRDPAIAEIMDMGFTADQAKRALAETDTGLDVEAAVGWLLEDAHQKNRPAGLTPPQQERGREPRGESSRQPRTPSNEQRRERERGDANTPAWARGGPRPGEKDIGAYAAEVGGTLFKSANSLWSTGRKKMERAVAELKADLVDGGGDPTQPKWMRERQIREELEKRGAKGISRNDRPPSADEEDTRSRGRPEAAITDEALMLEMGGGPPPPRRKLREERLSPAPSRNSGMSENERIQQQRMLEMETAIREKEREMHERALRERERSRAGAAIPDSASRKAKLASESEPVYVSRNRRRPPPSSASASKPSTPEPDLLGGGSGSGLGDSRGSSSLNPFARDMAAESQRSPQPSTISRTPTPRRPAPKPRQSVPISPSALAQSNAARQKGTDAFKRGDYTAADTFYTSALAPVPETHPLCIILLANRSLCKVKLGGPKDAIVDADAILHLIGESRGESETITLDGTEKDMKDYWLKAIMRKAECLEQLEKWGDAKDTWELALTAGGNAAAINGKRRCEAALKPKAPPKPKAPVKPKVPSPSAKPNVAVAALRKANADQERQDNERLELHDIVHDRIGNWKNGKEGNLRALLAGLDTVLWEGSGWKKVGMGELLIPQKCKIAYMKGIAKVHPDKISQDATTEQKMVSAAVFSLLNDSWEIFKTENGL
ncbi:hypothetical protein BZA05DRAFT_98102 [Tricharina praecox]|uniref:uncharacterized protein n=1 Tax=Tricharina praecox TaxID=43433 RepID=UPI00221E5918|nr:uncharacterized protein BZA05DRAFT_98102 [Tricharina praecox]KAI5857510.1 hypothetical protein BZA05DRAFT_98102 [Tricharina praecox]